MFALIIIIIMCLSKKCFIREEYGVNNFWNNPLSKYTVKLYSGLLNVFIPPNSYSSAPLSNTTYYNFSFFFWQPVCQSSIIRGRVQYCCLTRDLVRWYIFIVNVTQQKNICVNLTYLYQGDPFRTIPPSKTTDALIKTAYRVESIQKKRSF